MTAISGEFFLDTWDLGFQSRFAPAERQEITWGLGQRFVNDSFQQTRRLTYSPLSRLNYISNAFVQDEISLGSVKFIV